MASRVVERFSRRIEVVVRHCEERDLAPLEWLGSYAAHRLFIREQFERHERGENVMLVADHAGFPVGQVWIDLVRRGRERIATIWALRVMPSLQRLGIGRHLIGAAERVATYAGFRAAEIGVEQDNPGARAWYERLGYGYVRDEVVHQSYALPDGGVSIQIFDQAILRKPLAPTRS